jgi:hypothetical protein
MIKTFFLALSLTAATAALLFVETCGLVMVWEWMCAKVLGVDVREPIARQKSA